MGGGKVAIAGVGLGQSIRVDGHYGIQPQAFDRRLIVSLDLRQVPGHHRVAGGAPFTYSLLGFHNGRANHVEAAARSLRLGERAMGGN